jgi:large subunit ribosomal protein L15
MPLHRRLPKRGFTNIFRIEYAEVNLDRLDKIAKAEITPKDLAEARLIPNVRVRIKILGRGEVTSAKSVQAHKFSATAQAKIEKAGGQAVLIGR